MAKLNKQDEIYQNLIKWPLRRLESECMQECESIVQAKDWVVLICSSIGRQKNKTMAAAASLALLKKKRHNPSQCCPLCLEDQNM